MKFTILTLTGLTTMAVFSLSFADPTNDRFVNACVAEGDSQSVCQCSANAMQSVFDAEVFEQITSNAETGNHDAGAQVLQTVFANQPELKSALTEALALCQ